MEYKKELEYFKTEIKRIRENQGLSEYKASLCCGFPTHSGWYYIEKSGNPRLENLLRFSKGLGIDFEIKNGKLFILD